MKTRYRLALLAALITLTAGCDQATKRVAMEELRDSPPRSYAGDTFRLQYSENPGAFLSLGADLPEEVRGWVMVGGVGSFLTALLLYGLLSSKLRPLTVVAIGLLVGGGYSNWADRLMRGNVVVDFMNVGVGPVRSGIFNVADLFIEAGALLMVFSLLRPQREPAPAPSPDVNSEEAAGTAGLEDR